MVSFLVQRIETLYNLYVAYINSTPPTVQKELYTLKQAFLVHYSTVCLHLYGYCVTQVNAESGRNRLSESLSLFEQILNLPYWKETDIILFLNKSEIFDTKIMMTSHLQDHFPAYTGIVTK